MPACRPSAPDYAAQDATFNRIRAAAATREAARSLRDTGADSARPAPARLFDTSDASARRLFLVDASGSMLAHVESLRSSLTRAIDNLPADTAFALVAFADDEVSSPAPHWLPATPQAKARAVAFLGTLKPFGSSDLSAAFRRVWALQPQTVYLLTDGDFPDIRALVLGPRALTLPSDVTLHIVAFGPAAADDPLFERLANDHGGTFTRLGR